MPKHIEVHKLSGSSGEVVLVRMLDKKLIDPILIQSAFGEIAELVDEGHTKVVISFGNVEMLTSPSLNALIKLKQKMDGKAGTLRICNLSPVIRDVFAFSKLVEYFGCKTTEKDALANI